MSNRRQISIRRMLVVVSLLCAAMSAITFAFKANVYDSIPAVTLAAAGALFGAAAGMLFHKPIAGAAAGFLVVGIPIALLRELFQGAHWH